MESIQVLVLLSGPIAVGKTSVRNELLSGFGFDYVRSSGYLQEMLAGQGQIGDRRSLQDFGDSLDVETDYRWVLDRVAMPAFDAAPEQRRWLVDAVRKLRQVEHFRQALGPVVMHVHLSAAEDVLQRRYAARMQPGVEAVPYSTAVQHPNEVASRQLIEVADLVLDTGESTPTQVAFEIAKAARIVLK